MLCVTLKHVRSTRLNKDVINMLHVTKNAHESGRSCKCVYADKYFYSGVNLQTYFPAA